ncbi:hypothetical protein ANN_28092 [Periplaneta americana]|uniref:Uncharacterized protein n=1 Tax=Periplaneta americana TaxID=6978 RepID=A0ABQ8RUY2_PERAM|nr:hypothetical protein ANN_28092 [Periplaneta americana]
MSTMSVFISKFLLSKKRYQGKWSSICWLTTVGPRRETFQMQNMPENHYLPLGRSIRLGVLVESAQEIEVLYNRFPSKSDDPLVFKYPLLSRRLNRISNLRAEQSHGITVFRISALTSLMLQRCSSSAYIVAQRLWLSPLAAIIESVWPFRWYWNLPHEYIRWLLDHETLRKVLPASNSKNCPKYVVEKDIQELRVRENITFFEERKRILDQQKKAKEKSYAAVLKKATERIDAFTQTPPLPNINRKRIEIPTLTYVEVTTQTAESDDSCGLDIRPYVPKKITAVATEKDSRPGRLPRRRTPCPGDGSRSRSRLRPRSRSHDQVCNDLRVSHHGRHLSSRNQRHQIMERISREDPL